MDLGIRGRVAVVTASSKGIGKAVAKAFLEEGAKVVICSRNKENLLKAEEELKRVGGELHKVEVDLGKKEDIEKLKEETLKEFGTIDILFLNAGGPKPGGFFDVDEGDWEHVFKVNLMSAIRLIKTFIDEMKKKKWGRIIALTSVTVKQPIRNLILSNSIRLGITGFMKTLSLDLAPYNITVNCVAPGYTMTERVKELLEDEAKRTGKSFEEVLREKNRSFPMKRMADPEEIASVVAFLASEKASYITGQTVTVDGGMSLCYF